MDSIIEQTDDANEEVDVYSKDGTYIRTMKKLDSLEPDEWLKCVTCFVMDEEYMVAVQKRSANKKRQPGKKDLCSGHVSHNEVYTQSMIREINEEFGISIEELINSINSGNMIRLGNLKMDFTKTGEDWRCITEVFVLFREKIKREGLTFNPNEIDMVTYYTHKAVFEMIRNGNTRFPYTEEYENIFSALEKEVKFHKINRLQLVLGFEK